MENPLSAGLLENDGSKGRRREKLALLYLFAFWTQINPSEAFLVDYLVEEKGLSDRQVFQRVFDLFIYSRLPCVALVGLLSELPFCSNRFLLVVGTTCGLITTLLTRFGDSLVAQQAAQFFVAASFASRMVVPTIAFELAMPSEFQRAIHRVKATVLIANAISALLGEALRDNGVSLTVLVDLSIISQLVALFCGLTIPVLDCECSGQKQLHAGGYTARRPGRGRRRWCSCLRASMRDLWRSLKLRKVFCWTAWALLMNPVHGLTMTYWQSLVRAKHIFNDHNGLLLASMYFVAALLTLLTGGAAPLRRGTATLVVGSMTVAGVLLHELASESREFTLYVMLLLYFCTFEVMTAIATFQVGVEVIDAVKLASSPPPSANKLDRSWSLHSGDSMRKMTASTAVPTCARLTLLFSATGIAGHACETSMQLFINGVTSMEARLSSLGVALLVGAGIFLVASLLEATWKTTFPSSMDAEDSSVDPSAALKLADSSRLLAEGHIEEADEDESPSASGEAASDVWMRHLSPKSAAALALVEPPPLDLDDR
eukprot:TRINITY_DN59975_c0_g1_i1.p1 TRINITY_DN59975_c0_g1~~TRINITY_DN59975_c0_g1_i1.p1  ORF type:complete len:544 (-),score=128.40 TRINITY_DN59975_c0_g1_i1:43-1674(-)